MKTRNYNLELLRIIAMFMIVVLHYCCHGYQMTKVGTAGYNTPILWLIYTFCYCAVNIYVLISGYFLCKSEFKWKKVFKIYIEVLFYSIIIFSILTISGTIEITKSSQIITAFLPIISKAYWFVTIYLSMYVISPFLNKLIDALDQKEYIKMLLTLGILIMICNNAIPGTFFLDKTYGFGIIWFTYLYLVAAYIRIYDIPPIKKRFLILIYFFCYQENPEKVYPYLPFGNPFHRILLNRYMPETQFQYHFLTRIIFYIKRHNHLMHNNPMK